MCRADYAWVFVHSRGCVSVPVCMYMHVACVCLVIERA